MSFFDSPIVDDNAKASEESVLEVKRFFCNKNGFISRDDYPDYGCDLEVELIVDSKSASNLRFPIQIKSWKTNSYVAVRNSTYLTKSFKTSRLGYLCQRAPAYGLIIIYVEDEAVCYYDYVEEIIERINKEKPDDEWKHQESINIHIPISNILNPESIVKIHLRLCNRFTALDSLINSFGGQFGIPSFKPIKHLHNNKVIHPLESLEKYGLSYLNSREYYKIYELLQQLLMKDALSSKTAIFLSCIVYGEMGKCIEAEFYLSKAYQIFESFDEQQKEMIKFVNVKVEFLLGKRDKSAFLEDLRNMKEVVKHEYNAILLNITILYFTIIQRKESKNLGPDLEINLLSIFNDINQAGIDQSSKSYLNVFNSENLHLYTSSIMLNWVGDFHVKKSLKIYVPPDDVWLFFGKANGMIDLTTIKVLASREFALQAEDKILEAYCNFALALFFYIKEFYLFLSRLKDNNINIVENFHRSFSFAFRAYELFLSLGMFKDARRALICSYEIWKLADLQYGINLSLESTARDLNVELINKLNTEIGLMNNFESTVDKAYKDFQEQDNNPMKAIAELQDDILLSMAQRALKEYGLPPERLVNLFNELKAYQFFAKYCNTEDYILLTDLSHGKSVKTFYATPSIYIVRSIKTSIESLPSPNIEQLCKDHGILITTSTMSF